MKKVFSLFFISFTLISFGQTTWQWVGTGANDRANVILETTPGSLIVGGRFNILNGLISSPGLPLIVEGTQTGSATWQWTKLGSADGSIEDAAYFQNEIFIAGRFGVINESTNAYGIAKYNGVWSPVIGSGILCGFNEPACGMYALQEYNGELYAGGTFTNINGSTFKHIAKWNGSVWSAVGTGINTTNSSTGVRDMIVYNNELYVIGDFNNAGGVSATNIAKWNGSTWSAVATIQGTLQQIMSAQVFDGSLYIGGNFSGIGGVLVNRLARFDGSTWTDAGQGLLNCGYVSSLSVFQDTLYAAGTFNFPNSNQPFQHIGKWNGTTWVTFGAIKRNFTTGSVSLLSTANDALFVSGVFDAIDNMFLGGIAVYDPSSTETGLSEHLMFPNFKVTPHPFNTSATITFDNESEAVLTLFDCIGREVRRTPIFRGSAVIERKDLSPGVYTMRIAAGENVLYKKIVVTNM